MVKNTQLKVNWALGASRRFKKIYHDILKHSYSNAQKVTTGIEATISKLPSHPEKYPLDKFKKDNPGNYRAFEKYSFRIAYKHTEDEIKILRIRHVKEEPKSY